MREIVDFVAWYFWFCSLPAAEHGVERAGGHCAVLRDVGHGIERGGNPFCFLGFVLLSTWLMRTWVGVLQFDNEVSLKDFGILAWA